MANWFYYNEQGEKICVTGGQLKWLAKNGQITPGTMIETEDGKTAPAKKVKGLTFSQPTESPPIENVIEQSPSDNEVNDDEEKTSTETVRPKLFVDTEINFGELLAATKTKNGAEKEEADTKFKAALLTMGGDINGKVDGKNTRLQLAVLFDDPELIIQLVRKGANPNQKDDSSRLPLHYAIVAGNLKTVAALIEHGADVNAKTGNGMTPLGIAIAKNKPEIAELLRKSGAEEKSSNPLSATEKGINDPIHEDGMTKLIQAVLNDDPQAITQLEKGGADVEAKDNDGVTALRYAVVKGSVKCINALLEAGADIEAKDDNGLAALYTAVASGNVEVVTTLLEAGANTETKCGERGLTVLHIAVAQENVAVVTALLEAGAKNDAKDNSGLTPLQIAERQGKYEIANLLRNTKVKARAKAICKIKKMADMTSKERLTTGARYIKRRTDTIEQIKTLERRQNDPKELSIMNYFNSDGVGYFGCGCFFLVSGVLLIGFFVLNALVATGTLGEWEMGVISPLCFLLIVGIVVLGIMSKISHEKWRTDRLSSLDSEQEQATLELAELHSALAWYDNLPPAEKSKFDADVLAEEKRKEEERKRQEQERKRRESICPQCGKEWALNTSWETVNTHSEFRTEIKEETSWNRSFTDVNIHKVPVQIQTLVTTEREITKCRYCSFRREGASRENRREIR